MATAGSTFLPHARRVGRRASAGLLAALCGVAVRGAPCRAQTPATAAPAPAQVASARGTLTIAGLVHDSLLAAPLAGATVQLVSLRDLSRSRTVTADSSGRWRIDSVPPGHYLIGFLHPRWNEIGIELPSSRLDLTRGAPAGEVLLATPSARWLHTLLCPSARDSTGAIFGVVRDAEDGGTILDATVVVTWYDVVISQRGLRREPHRVPARARDGSFVVCNLPADAELVVSAEAPGWTGGLLELEVPGARMLRRDVSLGDSTVARRVAASGKRGARAPSVARGSARLIGLVRDPEGKPLRNAQVLVHGTEATGRTDDRGAFTLGDLPAGSYTLEARAIGFVPRRVPVDLSTRRTASADVQLAQRATELAATVVMGRRSRLSRVLAEFNERRQRALSGRFITPADVERMQPYYVTDVLRSTPGLQVVSTRGFGSVLRGRGGCTPSVYVDNYPVPDGASELDRIIRVPDLAAVEVYTGVGSTPMPFQDRGCGTVIVWTKK